MKIRVERLREALNLLKPAVPGKATLPVTKNILLGDGRAVATDLEVTVVLDLPEADVSCLIPHRSALELLRYVPGDELLTIEARRGVVNFSWDGGGASYDVPEPEEYPPLPEIKAMAEGTMDGDTLVKALTTAIDYCSTDDKRPVLTGVHLFLGEQVTVAAADGFKMSYQELPVSFPAEETAIIPAQAVKVLAHLWNKAPAPPPLRDSLIEQITAHRDVSLALGDQRLRVSFGRVTLTVKLIEGTPPSYLQLIPKEEEMVSQANVFAPEFERAVRRVANVARDNSNIVRLIWNETALTVTARSEEKGKVEAKVPLVGEATPGKFAVNFNYLLGYLKDRQGVVSIGVKTEQSPVLFRHGQSPLVLLMPMVVQW